MLSSTDSRLNTSAGFTLSTLITEEMKGGGANTCFLKGWLQILRRRGQVINLEANSQTSYRVIVQENWRVNLWHSALYIR